MNYIDSYFRFCSDEFQLFLLPEMRHEAFGVKNILEFPVFFIVPSDPPSLFQFLFLRFLVSFSCFLSVVFVHFLVVFVHFLVFDVRNLKHMGLADPSS